MTPNKALQRTVLALRTRPPLSAGVRRPMCRAAVFVTLLSASVCLASDPPKAPLKSGTYRFQWKDAEFANSPGFPVKVEIDGERIRVVNEQKDRAAPVGTLDEGVLMWHAQSKQWILGHDESDKFAPTVGGCGDSDPYV